jgi:protocatechuate 3,4-dioxygenase beta subunit
MKRKDFLKGLGFASAATVLPLEKAAANTRLVGGPACVLVPSETAGPFPLDLTTNAFYFRQDVREDRTGVKFNLKLKIMGENNCLPMPNLRVNIWHCSKDGLYSGYDNNMNAGQGGKTYLRGYQMTNANGEVDFTTVFPGWYNGRIAHIHFQVFVSSIYAAVSQMTFEVAEKNAIYAANPTFYPQGADPTALTRDNVFSDGYTYQICKLTKVSNTEYNGYMEATIKGNGITALAEAEPETGGQFKLRQNYPNPYKDATNIPFSLVNASKVTLELYDLAGQKVASVVENNLGAGDQAIALNMAKLGIANGNYAYQLVVENANGVFRQTKIMTAM